VNFKDCYGAIAHDQSKVLAESPPGYLDCKRSLTNDCSDNPTHAFGATGVSLKDYALGSISMIPGTVMYVYIVSLAGDLARIGTENQPGDPVVQWIIRLLGFIATVAVTLYVTQIARKALEEKVSLNPD
jgi:hypothetical protein